MVDHQQLVYSSSSPHENQQDGQQGWQQQNQKQKQITLPRGGSDCRGVACVDRPPQRPRRRRISFGHVKIVEFPYGISSSAVCNSGPPIALADQVPPVDDENITTDHHHQDENVHQQQQQQQRTVLPNGDESTSDVIHGGGSSNNNNNHEKPATFSTVTTSIIGIDEYESYRPQQRRSKSDLHLSADRRRELLLEKGFDMGEIDEATKDANRIRRRRAETIREIRLSISTNAATATTTMTTTTTAQMNVVTESSLKSSTFSNLNTNYSNSKEQNVVCDGDGRQTLCVPPACPSPVATSPIRRSRKRWNGRRGGFRGPARDSLSPTPRQSGRRLSSAMLVDTLSPPSESFRRLSCLSPQNNNSRSCDAMVMKKRNTDGPKLSPRFTLSPPRPLRDRTGQQPTASIPIPRLTPKRKRAPSITQLSPSSDSQNSSISTNFNWSMSQTAFVDRTTSGCRMVDENSSTFLSPPKRRRTPTKVDSRPLVLPTRTYSPPPSPLVSSHNFYHR